jgi:hypothetical protein
MMIEHIAPPADGRGRYPDRIAAAAPRGFRECVKRAASAERISVGEFVRRAIMEHISRVTEDCSDAR